METAKIWKKNFCQKINLNLRYYGHFNKQFTKCVDQKEKINYINNQFWGDYQITCNNYKNIWTQNIDKMEEEWGCQLFSGVNIF